MVPLQDVSFHFFTVGINSNAFPGLYTPYKKPTPQIFSDIGRDFMACDNDDGLSECGLMTSLGKGKDRSLNKITGKLGNEPVSHYFIE